MDEMKITTGFMRRMLSKVISTVLQKKLDCNVDVQLNDVYAGFTGNKVHVHLSIDAEMDKAELMRIIKNAGLI